MSSISTNIAAVHERINSACRRAGRAQHEVRLMVVTKTQSRESVEEAYAAGARLFGENRIAEAQEKFADFHPEAELHMIGHLQRNKAGRAVGLVRCVQSIDKLETASVLERRCEAVDASIDVLLEMNTSEESSKEGFRSEDDLIRALEAMLELRRVRPRGLMTIAALTSDQRLIRSSFERLRLLKERIDHELSPDGFGELSMGMTNDFELAIEEGATLIRVGSAIFGPRAVP